MECCTQVVLIMLNGCRDVREHVILFLCQLCIKLIRATLKYCPNVLLFSKTELQIYWLQTLKFCFIQKCHFFYLAMTTVFLCSQQLKEIYTWINKNNIASSEPPPQVQTWGGKRKQSQDSANDCACTDQHDVFPFDGRQRSQVTSVCFAGQDASASPLSEVLNGSQPPTVCQTPDFRLPVGAAVINHATSNNPCLSNAVVFDDHLDALCSREETFATFASRPAVGDPVLVVGVVECVLAFWIAVIVGLALEAPQARHVRDEDEQKAAQRHQVNPLVH